MAEARKGIVLRLSTEGAETVRRALRELGKDGEAALARMERASKTVPPHLRAIDTAAKGVRAEAEGMAGRLGIAGRALAALGPGGLAAGAGIAAAGLAIGKAVGIARDAVRDFDELNKRIEDLGIAGDLFQGVQFGANLAGISDDKFYNSLRRFTTGTEEAARGTGGMVTALKALDPELLRALQSTGDVSERLRLAADAFAREENAAKRATLAKALFGDEGVRLAQVLSGGRAALDGFVREAERAGVVVRRDMLESASETARRLDVTAKVIDLNLKQAFVDLAPVLTAASDLFARLAVSAANFVDSLRDIGRQTRMEVLVGELDAVHAAMNRTQDALAAARRNQPTGNLMTDLLGVLTGGAEGDTGGLADVLAELKRKENAILDRIAELNAGGSRSTAPGTVPPPPPEADAERKRLEALGKAWSDKILTPAERYSALLRDLAAAHRQGSLGEQEYFRARAEAEKDYLDLLDREKSQRLQMQADFLKSGLKGFIADLQAGKSWLDALGDAASRAASRVADIAIDRLVDSLFGINTRGGASGGLFGGAIIPGILHGGYGPGDRPMTAGPVPAAAFAGAPRFHTGRGPGEMAAIIRNDEGVFTPGQMRALGRGVSAGGTIRIEVGVQVDDDGRLGAIAREAGRSGGAEAADVRVTSFSRSELPYRLREIERHPRRVG